MPTKNRNKRKKLKGKKGQSDKEGRKERMQDGGKTRTTNKSTERPSKWEIKKTTRRRERGVGYQVKEKALETHERGH